MDINIKLKAGRNGDTVELVEKEPVTVEGIVSKYLNGTKKYYIASVNNRYRELGYLIEEDADIVLHDMTKLIAMQTYQHSLIMIYLKAVRDVKGDLSVTIENSLNQGLFSAVKGGAAVSEEDAAAIENRMKEIIKEDIPFVRGFVAKEDAIAFCKRRGLDEKAELLADSDVEDEVEYYSLDNYSNFFFGYMVPSTSYIDLFELRRYRQGMLLRFPNERCPDAIPEYRDDVKLYEAFAETKKWRRIMDVEYLADLNRVIAEGRASELIIRNEELQDKRFAEIAKQIVDSGKRIVLMAGPSSSGKTTSAKRLCEKIAELSSEPLYLGTDDYFLNRDETPLGPDGQPNFEDLSALDLNLFNENMNGLLAGREVDIPEFDFITGKKIFGKRIISAGSDQIIVIEGIHSLNEEMTAAIPDDVKFKVYISPLTRLSIDRHNRLSTSDARMLRRMVRDKQFRGYAASKTLGDWHKVRAGEEKNIFPYSNSADAVINSSMTYETALLKKYAEPLLREIEPDDPQYGEALRMLHFIKYFDIIEDDTAVPDNSIMREFIGKRK
ncbi:MAG: nucleoside kinase [Clostridiales bacterium]|nr:nucleoside kinase [Candidatus Crickella merdequi]